jgi:hypothetical protein
MIQHCKSIACIEETKSDYIFYFISIVIMISGEEIAVLFNNTILLDNSMITWDDFDILQCGVSSTNIDETSYFSQPTTITFSQTLLTTVQTEPVRK